MMTVSVKHFTITALLGMANGHMIMNTPTPYNYHKSSPLLQVNPLSSSSTEIPFPCQGLSTIEEVTTMKAGEPQPVKFTGGAQHGGGSCQFSLTYEYPPPADKSKWKTIYTIIGGCPAGYNPSLPDAAQNLPPTAPDQDGRADSAHCAEADSTEIGCIRSFNIPIPKDVPNGNATFAWTWYNRIGNREVYMNCAPVSITGGSNDHAFFDSLPELFLANVPGECSNKPGVFNIPNPGRFGRVLEPPTPGANGLCPEVLAAPIFEADGAPVPPANNKTGPATTAPAPPSAVPTTLLTITRSVANATLATPYRPVPTPSTPSGSVPSSSGPGRFPCAPGAALFCFDATHFALCGSGVAQERHKLPVADGTKCIDGKIVAA
ncbi:hypothetical protein B0T16DRAFT_430810 [Cercophora newfieldiana]|uniref:Lytic polysaccharide monooxygenase n=1 Tax=Cercophora newfieldiana TaxID=92897 RepID=A0AA39XV06_9PEZI|nr:hypothetical protein B0T16DRAFT_430810 [Cercophora newfieldiana]